MFWSERRCVLPTGGFATKQALLKKSGSFFLGRGARVSRMPHVGNVRAGGGSTNGLLVFMNYGSALLIQKPHRECVRANVFCGQSSTGLEPIPVGRSAEFIPLGLTRFQKGG